MSITTIISVTMFDDSQSIPASKLTLIKYKPSLHTSLSSH